MSENPQTPPEPPEEFSDHTINDLSDAFTRATSGRQSEQDAETEDKNDVPADNDSQHDPLLTLFHGDEEEEYEEEEVEEEDDQEYEAYDEEEGEYEEYEEEEEADETEADEELEASDDDDEEYDEEYEYEEEEEDELVDEEAICPISPRSIFEAMLFVGDPENHPLPAGRATDLMRGVDPEEIPRIVNELNADYTRRGCPYRVVNQPGGYRLELEPSFESVRRRFYGKVREVRLSQAAVDVLATVAYRQPITADEVTKIRDHPSQGILGQLVRRGLLSIERSSDRKIPARYSTTDRFLELFNLESIDFLPQTEDIDEN